jgi:ferredoxin
MPTVKYKGEEIKCEEGKNLKELLLENGLTPHKGITNKLNCGGNGTCGTCRVRKTSGAMGQNEQSLRLKLSGSDEDVVLACQFNVYNDIEIEQT